MEQDMKSQALGRLPLSKELFENILATDIDLRDYIEKDPIQYLEDKISTFFGDQGALIFDDEEFFKEVINPQKTYQIGRFYWTVFCKYLKKTIGSPEVIQHDNFKTEEGNQVDIYLKKVLEIE